MDAEDTSELRLTPTDPSLEFDVFEMARVRLVEALERRGYELIRAERIALYLVEVARPAAKFVKVMTRDKPPSDEQIFAALHPMLEEAPALEKAGRMLQHKSSEEERR